MSGTTRATSTSTSTSTGGRRVIADSPPTWVTYTPMRSARSSTVSLPARSRAVIVNVNLPRG